jgi:hypothetical protein
MRRETAKKFLEDNREALTLLGEKLKEISNVMNCKDETELRANKKAYQIIENWLTDLFNLTNYDIMEVREDDYLYKRLEHPET